MLTILTIPKPFKDPHINVIQRNALLSWLKLSPKPTIILFGNDKGIDKAAEEFGVLHVPEVENEFGIPRLDAVFDTAKKMSSDFFMAYINTDIILTSDFAEALKLIKIPKFLMSGRRRDVGIKTAFDFSQPDYEWRLRNLIAVESRMHGWAGMDYFVFPKDLELNMPAFVAGRPGYDNWLVYRARFLGIPVIDATEMVTVIHQNHDYSHSPYGRKGKVAGPETQKNLKLAGGFSNMCTLRDADWILTASGLTKPPFPRRIFSGISLFYPWRLILAFKRKLQFGKK